MAPNSRPLAFHSLAKSCPSLETSDPERSGGLQGGGLFRAPAGGLEVQQAGKSVAGNCGLRYVGKGALGSSGPLFRTPWLSRKAFSDSGIWAAAAAQAMVRSPTGHINIRILHSGSKAQYMENPRNDAWVSCRGDSHPPHENVQDHPQTGCAILELTRTQG